MTSDRRTFLKRSGAALSAAALSACVPGDPSRDGGGRSEADGGPGGAAALGLDAARLRALGDAVLPSELGADGREAAVSDFERWVAEYAPGFELNHGYGTSEIRHGPPHPAPAWAAQLDTLDAEARIRHGAGFADVGPEARLELVREQVETAGDTNASSPLRAGHVAVALLAHWLSSPGATDLCYGARISPRTCRGIPGSASQPEALA